MIENNATRLALIDALLNPRGPDLPGRDVKYGNEISPMMTGLHGAPSPLRQGHGLDTYSAAVSPVMTGASNTLNQWGQREYDVYDPRRFLRFHSEDNIGAMRCHRQIRRGGSRMIWKVVLSAPDTLPA